eukprot:Sspe_Gene.1053::Locus_359_Transcript_2_3_Confidence_0.500_Length_1006::g.1053::m.1053
MCCCAWVREGSAVFLSLQDTAVRDLDTFKGLSRGLVEVFSIFRTTSIPSTTFPKTTCRPSSHEVSAVVMKNCDPLVFLPALAMERHPTKCLMLKFSSSNFSPLDRLPPRSVPAGEVTTLDHEVLDHTVEGRSLVPKALRPRRQLAEVLRRLRDVLPEETDHNTAGRLPANGDVEVHLLGHLGFRSRDAGHRQQRQHQQLARHFALSLRV